MQDRRFSAEEWVRLYTVVILAACLGALIIAAFLGETLLYKPFLRFNDLTTYLEKTKHPVGMGEAIVSAPPQMNYPAPAIFVYSAFANLPGDGVSWLVGVILLAAVGGVLLIDKPLALAKMSIGTRVTFGVATLVTSYPLWFELERANIEGVLWTFLVLSAFFFSRHRFLLSGISLALACTIKPFPLILFGVFFACTLYRELIISLITWTCVSVSAFILTSGSLYAAMHHYSSGASEYQNGIAAAYKAVEINYDHSLFALVKQGLRLALNSAPESVDSLLAALYPSFLALALCGALVCVYILWRMPLLNQALGVFVLMVLLPPSNYDYTLLSLYVPFAFFIAFLVDDVTQHRFQLSCGRASAVLLCFAIIFTPQTFLRLNQTGFGGEVKALALLGLLFLALSSPMQVNSWEDALVKKDRWRKPAMLGVQG